MRHFVQYHNIDRDGSAPDGMVACTNKPAPDSVGHVVWVIAGRGRPRVYSLLKAFVVEHLDPPGDEPARHCLRGSQGLCFDPPLGLDEQPWFAPLWKSLGTPSLGLREIRVRTFLVGLLDLAEAHGWRAES